MMSNEKDNRIIRLNTGESEIISNEDEMRIRKENFQLAKDEIETLMDCLNEEMKRIDETQSGIHHKIQREQKMLQTEPSLARSTLKSFTKNISLAFLSFDNM
jgi:hypothetical protein